MIQKLVTLVWFMAILVLAQLDAVGPSKNVKLLVVTGLMMLLYGFIHFQLKQESTSNKILPPILAPINTVVVKRVTLGLKTKGITLIVAEAEAETQAEAEAETDVHGLIVLVTVMGYALVLMGYVVIMVI
jgi:hypothetical protein